MDDFYRSLLIITDSHASLEEQIKYYDDATERYKLTHVRKIIARQSVGHDIYALWTSTDWHAFLLRYRVIVGRCEIEELRRHEADI